MPFIYSIIIIINIYLIIYLWNAVVLTKAFLFYSKIFVCASSKLVYKKKKAKCR